MEYECILQSPTRALLLCCLGIGILGIMIWDYGILWDWGRKRMAEAEAAPAFILILISPYYFLIWYPRLGIRHGLTL
jgi:hypothetical protein